MTGDTFEMEDQRNWTDASFKTYCRPLARPRPFALAPANTISQTLTITLSGTPTRPRRRHRRDHRPPSPPSPSPTTPPSRPPPPPTSPPPPSSSASTPAPPTSPARSTPPSPSRSSPTPPPTSPTVAALCAAAGLAPARVVALPRAYLASHQPEGPWPTPTPADFLAPARAAFPGAEIGGGALTNFTEFNRCPPDPAQIDFATFGTTAIVHAADDRSVRETLESFPAVFASARALAAALPLHLGLVSIAMRSNPYGSATAPNPDHRRLAMATDDPRQQTPFAAAFALGAIAEAARAGIASLAPAMAAGPLAAGPALARLIAALAPLAGQPVRLDGGPGRLLVVTAGALTLAANLGPDPVRFRDRTLASMEIAA